MQKRRKRRRRISGINSFSVHPLLLTRVAVIIIAFTGHRVNFPLFPASNCRSGGEDIKGSLHANHTIWDWIWTFVSGAYYGQQNSQFRDRPNMITEDGVVRLSLVCRFIFSLPFTLPPSLSPRTYKLTYTLIITTTQHVRKHHFGNY